MREIDKNSAPPEDSEIDEKRRNFLRKSVYAAYATPVIVSLLANKANANWKHSGFKRGHHHRPPHLFD